MLKNVFFKNRPHGGTITGLAGNFGQRFVLGIQGVCVESLEAVQEISYTDGHDGHTDGRTNGVQNILSPHAFGLVETTMD